MKALSSCFRSSPQVGQLAHGRECESGIGLSQRRRSVQGVVDEVCHKHRKRPVVGAVLDQAADWDGGVAESAAPDLLWSCKM